MKIIQKLSVVAALAYAVVIPEVATACGQSTPCKIENGEYFIAMPEDAEEKTPAIMFLHGYGGSGQGVFRYQNLIESFLSRGYAVVSPNGTTREGLNGRSWSFHPDLPKRRDEVGFLVDVRDAVIAQHGIDPEKFILTGFSIGGSLTSYVACARPDAFSAYAPVSGSFWRPHPTSCEGPVRLLHTHGWNDSTVPLEGRVIRGDDVRDPDAFVQGDVFHAMNVWRQTNECHQLRADRFETSGPFWRRSWERCRPGTALEFALFPGGHVIPQGWADMALDWFEKL